MLHQLPVQIILSRKYTKWNFIACFDGIAFSDIMSLRSSLMNFYL
jgi:hypothetical protein